MIGEILSDRVAWTPAIAFHLIYVSGILFLAVMPALEKESLIRALIGGAALGFVAYATYDLSNQATLKVWDGRMTLLDMAWGTFATTLAAGAGFWAARQFG
ncbi:MAG: DUF2177 family protein [Hyphomonadaceae bacterium]